MATYPSPEPATGRRLDVLLVEDDVLLRRALHGRLTRDGHRVDQAATIAEARRALDEAHHDCLVLDRLVPDGDTLDLVAELHRRPRRPSILVLSGLGEVDERIVGLRAGADDYVAKPVRLAELAMRVRNLGAWGPAPGATSIRLGDVVVDRERDRVVVAGAEVHLTPHQHAVLDYLVAHRHRMVTTEEVLEHCWDGDRPLFANPLHSQVTRLRRAFRGHLRIESVRGAGYVLKVEDPTCDRPSAGALRSLVGTRSSA